MFAICFTRPGTTLVFWLNRFYAGGFIWSLVRSSRMMQDELRWNQPPLRFDTEVAALDFIVSELAGNPQARVEQVAD